MEQVYIEAIHSGVTSTHVQIEAWESEARGDCVDDVDLAGVQTRRQALRGQLELKERRVPVGCVERGAFDYGRLEDLHLVPIERKARSQLGCAAGEGRIVDFVIEVQLLAAPDDVREIRHELDTVA